MAQRQTYGRQRPLVVEKEQAVVEGVELPGHWNRMFGSRVIDDYDTSTLEAVTALPGGESLGWCYQCAKCVGVCPVDIVGDYGPRKIHRDTLRGVSLLDSPALWPCGTCMNCLRVCPKAVDMTRIMPAAREAAIDQGRPIPPELQKVFEATDRYGNPLGENPRRRADWARGGGGMWLDGFTRDHVRMRLSDRRVLEVAETGAGTLAICCPYEVSRFEDAVKATGQEGRLDVRDIAELIDAAMRPS